MSDYFASINEYLSQINIVYLITISQIIFWIALIMKLLRNENSDTIQTDRPERSVETRDNKNSKKDN
jgi:hypothetical protein